MPSSQMACLCPEAWAFRRDPCRSAVAQGTASAPLGTMGSQSLCRETGVAVGVIVGTSVEAGADVATGGGVEVHPRTYASCTDAGVAYGVWVG